MSAFLTFCHIDSNGTEVVEYEYDAWGNHSVSGSKAGTLGAINPFRYRSYFYDTETGLYFLKSRYYDPYIGRFLNMDSVDYAEPGVINGLNLYAYCGNNPVMNVDPDGNFVVSIFIASIVLGTIGGAIMGAVKASEKGENVWIGALIGGLEGLVLGIALGVGAGIGAAAFAAGTTVSLTTGIAAFAGVAASSFGAGMGIYALETELKGTSFNTTEMLKRGFGLVLNASINFGLGLLFGCKGLYGIRENTNGLSILQKLKVATVSFVNKKNLLFERLYIHYGAALPIKLIINQIFNI